MTEGTTITDSTVRDGFTFSGGNANGASLTYYGGGLYCDGSDHECSPSLSNVTFSDWQRNPKLPAGTIQFTPPDDADVVGDKVEVPQIRDTGD